MYAKFRVDTCNVTDVIQEKNERVGSDPPGGRGIRAWSGQKGAEQRGEGLAARRRPSGSTII